MGEDQQNGSALAATARAQRHPTKTGRKVKPARDGRRSSLGLKVTPQTKRRLTELCKSSGRTQSQELEYHFERSLWLEDMMQAKLTCIKAPSPMSTTRGSLVVPMSAEPEDF